MSFEGPKNEFFASKNVTKIRPDSNQPKSLQSWHDKEEKRTLLIADDFGESSSLKKIFPMYIGIAFICL